MQKTASSCQLFMPDTVGISGLWELKYALNSEEWVLTEGKKSQGKSEIRWWKAHRLGAKHLTFYGYQDDITRVRKVECSLPTFIGAHNGQLLNSGDRVRAAIAALMDQVEQIATPDPAIPQCICRLDFAWQINTNIGGILNALEKSKLKRGRVTPMVYPGQSIHWISGDTHLHIYDKTAQLRNKGIRGLNNGTEILRVEIQWRSPKAVAAAFGKEFVTLNDIDLNACYDAFRRFIVDRLPTCKAMSVGPLKPTKANLLPFILARCSAENIRCNGEDFLAYCTRQLAPRGRRSLIAEVAAIKFDRLSFDFSKLFPPAVEDLRGVSFRPDGTLEEISLIP